MLTGASRGIGHATVKTFSDAGWRVLTISRHPFDPRCPWEGGAKNHIQLDLADIARVQAEMPRLRDIVGDGLDALINNAAISPKRAEGGKIGALEMAHADWLHIFNVNFFACVALVQGLRAPLEAARGAVVNMTSIVGSRVHPFASAAYAASKAALWALTRELAADLGRAGVRVNAVSPGEIDTGILSPGTEASSIATSRCTGWANRRTWPTCCCSCAPIRQAIFRGPKSTSTAGSGCSPQASPQELGEMP